LPLVIEALIAEGFRVAQRDVPYEFLRGADKMLCIELY
jgi:hypothetical protein